MFPRQEAGSQNQRKVINAHNKITLVREGLLNDLGVKEYGVFYMIYMISNFGLNFLRLLLYLLDFSWYS